MQPMQPSSSLSDIFAGLPTESDPLFATQELINGDYHDYVSVPEQEALQLLNQTNAFSLSTSPASSLPPSPLPRVAIKKEAKPAVTRKRQRGSDDASAEESNRKMTAVSLPREQLLRISSKDYETYMKEVTRKRDNLSQEELQDLRWMRRLVKNRESAQISRDRKKNRLDELMGIWTDLKSEQRTLQEQLTAAEISNKALKEELNNLVSIVRQSPALASLWNNMHILRKRTTAKIPDEKSLFNNQSAAAMCLLVAMHTHSQTLSARIAEAATPTPALAPTHEIEAPVARTKCMDASDDLRSEMQYIVDQQNSHASAEQPVLLMLLPQSAAASVLRNHAFAQNALVLDLAGAQVVPTVPVQA